MRVLVLILGCFVLGCPSAPCTSNDTKCESNTAWICDSRHEWRVLMDCTNVGGHGWECCDVGEGCACLPAEACE